MEKRPYKTAFHPLAGIWVLLRYALMSIGVFVLAVTFTPLVKWVGAELSTGWNESDGDVLILLGAATVLDPGPPPALVSGESAYWRAVYAIHVWRRGHFQKLLLCGHGSSEALKVFLVAGGIPESDILVENRSTSTRENALFAKPILAGLSGRFVLLTSDYHTYRAARCFAHEGIPVVTRPCPDLLKRANAPQQRWNCFWSLTGELAGIAYYRARGWI